MEKELKLQKEAEINIEKDDLLQKEKDEKNKLSIFNTFNLNNDNENSENGDNVKISKLRTKEKLRREKVIELKNMKKQELLLKKEKEKMEEESYMNFLIKYEINLVKKREFQANKQEYRLKNFISNFESSSESFLQVFSTFFFFSYYLIYFLSCLYIFFSSFSFFCFLFHE